MLRGLIQSDSDGDVNVGTSVEIGGGPFLPNLSDGDRDVSVGNSVAIGGSPILWKLSDGNGKDVDLGENVENGGKTTRGD